MTYIKYLMLHHSGTVDTSTLTWGIIRKNHEAVYGGAEHPYHYGVEYIRSSYEILLGRMPDLNGAHCATQGMNLQALGICIIGNFDKAPPSPAQWSKSLELVRYLMRCYSLLKDNVIGHREIKDTNCPGRFFDLAKFRAEL